MAYPEPAFLMHKALTQLAMEARQRLASLEAGAPEREFYVGVMTAAEDLSRTGHAVPRKIDHESMLFREGYLQVSNLVAAAVGHAPSRLPLPTPPLDAPATPQRRL
jgi:hypothetical protein